VSRAALLVALAACGRLHFDALAVGGDGGTGDGAPSDALALCDPETPFGTPTPITELNVAGAYDSTITLEPDELTAYFYSDRSGQFDIYIATRPDLATPFTVTPFTAIDSPDTDKEPGVAPDGSVLAFITTRPPADAGGDIWLSMPIGTAPAAVANLNSTASEYHPFFQLDTNDVYFCSNRNGNFSVFHTTYLGGGAFANPTQETSLDAAGYDTDVALAMPGGLVMYFRSTRPGGPGGEDIWRAERATTSDPWGTPVVETEVDSAQLDTPSWISRDGCRFYLSSSRTDASDIYIATRTP